MALSYAQYSGNGSATSFSVPFQYLARSHLIVSLDGFPTTDYSWTNSTTIRLNSAPANGVIVEVRRDTPKDRILVDFVDGSTLTETDLDTAALQSFFLAQESFDAAGGTLSVQPDGSFAAFNRRITAVADPVNDSDVVNKRWVTNSVNSNVAVASTAANTATAAREAATAARDQTQSYASQVASDKATAEAHKNTAVERATFAETKANAAAASELAAATSASNAAGSLLNANSARDAAIAARTGSETARDLAQKWADNPEDVAVANGRFSAMHWARKAAGYATAMLLPAVVAFHFIRGKPDGLGWETRTPAQVRADIGAAAAAHTHEATDINGLDAVISATSIRDKLLTVDGAGSGIDADKLDGFEPGYSAAGNTIATRDASGDVTARLFRTEYAATGTAPGYLVGMNTTGSGTDNYMRPITAAAARAALDVPTNAHMESRAQAWANDRNATVQGRRVSSYSAGLVGTPTYTATSAAGAVQYGYCYSPPTCYFIYLQTYSVAAGWRTFSG